MSKTIEAFKGMTTYKEWLIVAGLMLVVLIIATSCGGHPQAESRGEYIEQTKLIQR